MTRAIYLLGAPGVGKTTVMRGLKSPYVVGEARRAWAGSLLWLTPLYGTDRLAGVELGRTRESFGGTDALGMAVMPSAREWLRSTPRLPDLILGEGARLGTATFLTELADRADLLVCLLSASPEALASRRASRASNQDPAWMRGAETRARKAYIGCAQAGIPVVELDTTNATSDDVLNAMKELR